MEYHPPHFEIILKRNTNEIRLEIKDYKVPYIDFISNEIKEKISKFSDWIDFWAIDYDFSLNEDETAHLISAALQFRE